MTRIFLVVAAIVFALAILRAVFQAPETNTQMPLVYCHSQGGVVKDGKCVKKER